MILIKLKHGDDLRRIRVELETAWEDLLAHMQRIYGCRMFKISYKDDDNDMVTIGSSSELFEAVRMYKSHNATLKIVVQLDGFFEDDMVHILPLESEQQALKGEEGFVYVDPTRLDSDKPTPPANAILSQSELEDDWHHCLYEEQSQESFPSARSDETSDHDKEEPEIVHSQEEPCEEEVAQLEHQEELQEQKHQECQEQKHQEEQYQEQKHQEEQYEQKHQQDQKDKYDIVPIVNADSKDKVPVVDFSDLPPEEMVAAIHRACMAHLESHLTEFLASAPTASYEEWVAAVHPENSKPAGIDARFYLQGSEHRILWNDAVSAQQRVSPNCELGISCEDLQSSPEYLEVKSSGPKSIDPEVNMSSLEQQLVVEPLMSEDSEDSVVPEKQQLEAKVSHPESDVGPVISCDSSSSQNPIPEDEQEKEDDKKEEEDHKEEEEDHKEEEQPPNHTPVVLESKAVAKVHDAVCYHCGISPIHGNRYKCTVCPNFDLCQRCEDRNLHPSSHIMMKIRLPLLTPLAAQAHCQGG